MPNPKIQIIVEEKLKARLEAEAIKRGKSLSAYCGELLSMVHNETWIVVHGTKRFIRALRKVVR